MHSAKAGSISAIDEDDCSSLDEDWGWGWDEEIGGASCDDDEGSSATDEDDGSDADDVPPPPPSSDEQEKMNAIAAKPATIADFI